MEYFGESQALGLLSLKAEYVLVKQNVIKAKCYYEHIIYALILKTQTLS